MSTTRPGPSRCRTARSDRARAWPAAVTVLLALLTGCAGTPPTPQTPQTQRDGPPSDPPPGLDQQPDPLPRIEPIRTGGPNKPYVVFGQHYTPLARDAPQQDSGLASWYGRKFHGRPTASGEIYDMYALTAAHRTMPLPSYARVRNPANGREIIVRVNDRGPFHRDRVIDLSYAAALKLGVLRGVAPVQVVRLTHEDIASGRWRVDSGVPSPAAPADMPQLAAAQAVAGWPGPVDDVAAPRATRGFWLQFGAFAQRQGALELRQQLTREMDWLEPLLAVFDDAATYRVQAGPFASRGEAQRALERTNAALPRPPLIVQRK